MRRSLFGVLLIATPCLTGCSVSGQDGELLISAFWSDNVVVCDPWTGEPTGQLGPSGDLDGVLGVTLGPDRLLYVASEEANMVLRFDPSTFEQIDRFVWDDPDTPEDETGGLQGPTSVVFGPDGRLYVASFDSDAILRYNGTTGDFIDIFVDSGSGGLNGPDAGMAFGPDGHLYVPSYYSNSVPRYDGSTGDSMGDFIEPLSGGLRRPRHLIFRGDHLYVSAEGAHKVARYDATTGAYVDDFVAAGSGGLVEPSGIGFGPDGHFYVASVQNDSVLRYDGATGAFLDIFVESGVGGLDGPTFLIFLPHEGLALSPPRPGVAGRANELIALGAAPGERVYFAYSLRSGSSAVPGCPGVESGLAAPALIDSARADLEGRSRVTTFVPDTARGRVALIQALDRSACALSGVVTHQFQ